ncbi:MAG: TonB family protein [Bacteroidota bacterium]|nr:TonB family protein [Bacteroidota bacterium]
MNSNYYLLDIIFQNRNRYYGAYPLRLYYNERLLKSMLFTILGFAAFIYMLRWGFHEETVATIVRPAEKDSGHVVIIKTYEWDKLIKTNTEKRTAPKPIKGTPNTKPVIAPDIDANAATLDPKRKGAIDGEVKGKLFDGLIMPETGPITIHVTTKNPTIYTKVDKQAHYYDDLYQYLDIQISYPAAADKYGKVLLSFVVELDGSLSNIRVEQSLENVLDKEALEAFEKISKPGMWKPAEVAGKQVRFKYIIPINFLDPESL